MNSILLLHRAEEQLTWYSFSGDRLYLLQVEDRKKELDQMGEDSVYLTGNLRCKAARAMLSTGAEGVQSDERPLVENGIGP